MLGSTCGSPGVFGVGMVFRICKSFHGFIVLFVVCLLAFLHYILIQLLHAYSVT